MVKDLRLRCKMREEDCIQFSHEVEGFDPLSITLHTKDEKQVILSKHQAKTLKNWLDEAIKEME